MLVSVASAAVLHVGAGQSHATVTDAVAAAADGDTLVVHDAEIHDVVALADRRLAFVSTVGTQWSGAGPAVAVLEVVGGEVTVAGFVFDGVADTAIRGERATLRILDTTFAGNARALALVGGETELVRSVVRDHFGPGPAVDVDGVLHLRGVQLLDNATTDGPAALKAWPDAQVDAVRAWFVGNETAGEGGAVDCEGTCTFEDTRFVENAATIGSAIRATGSLALTRALFCRNAASEYAAIASYGPLTVANSGFLANTDRDVGPILFYGAATVRQSAFVDNRSDVSGVGLVVRPLVFEGNLVAHHPGGYPALLVAVGGSVDERWNAWYDNAGGELWWTEAPTDATDLLGQDPLLRSDRGRCTWNSLTPGAGSPLVDAGDPATADLDGSPADIGVRGGPEAP